MEEKVTMVSAAAPRQFASRIKVLIVDDHAVLRQALKLLLEGQQEVDVVGDAGNGREALEACERLHPDVVLMDMVMPGLNGLQVRQRPVEVGSTTVVGANGVVRREGMVFVNGELWRARTEGGEPLRSGDEVEVEGVDGLELVVRPRGA